MVQDPGVRISEEAALGVLDGPPCRGGDLSRRGHPDVPCLSRRDRSALVVWYGADVRLWEITELLDACGRGLRVNGRPVLPGSFRSRVAASAESEVQ